MTTKKIENCAHSSLKFADEGVEGVNFLIPVIRCKDCGEAITIFIPDDSFARLSDQLDEIYKKIKKLFH